MPNKEELLRELEYASEVIAFGGYDEQTRNSVLNTLGGAHAWIKEASQARSPLVEPLREALPVLRGERHRDINEPAARIDAALKGEK